MTEIWTAELLDACRLRGDPVADRVAQAILSQGKEGAVNAAWHNSLRLRAGTPLAGPDWEAFKLASNASQLSEEDNRRLLNGQLFFAKWGPLITLGLLTCSLPNSYAAAKGVKVLWCTTRLQTDASRRVMETAQLVLNTMKPGGLDETALETIRRVRLMHAYIRVLTGQSYWQRRGAAKPVLTGVSPAATTSKRLRRRTLVLARAVRGRLPGGCPTPPDWNQEDWGEPLNQEDLLGTLMAFSYLPLRTMRVHHVQFDQQGADDYIFGWSLIGKLLGIDEPLWTLLPQTEQQAAVCWKAISLRQQRPNCEGRELTKSLIRAMERWWPGYWLDPLVNEIFVHQLGFNANHPEGTVSEMFELRSSRWWKWAYRWLRWALRVGRVPKLTLANPAQRMFNEQLGYDLVYWLVTYLGDYRDNPFELPTSLRTIWEFDKLPGEVDERQSKFVSRRVGLSQRSKVELPDAFQRERNARDWAGTADGSQWQGVNREAPQSRTRSTAEDQGKPT